MKHKKTADWTTIASKARLIRAAIFWLVVDAALVAMPNHTKHLHDQANHALDMWWGGKPPAMLLPTDKARWHTAKLTA